MELKINDISKTYSGGVRALRSVSLTIPTGMFGLLGYKGSGKSVLFDGTVLEGRGELPDIEAQHSAEALLEGCDAPPERAIRHIVERRIVRCGANRITMWRAERR
jgi:ABC-type multidrug transport system ATPase subunit